MDNGTKWFATIIVMGFLVLTGILAYFPNAPSIVFQGYSSITAAFLAVVYYYFGSSLGSKIKDQIVSDKIKTEKEIKNGTVE